MGHHQTQIQQQLKNADTCWVNYDILQNHDEPLFLFTTSWSTQNGQRNIFVYEAPLMIETCQAEGFSATGTTKLKVPMTYIYTHDYIYLLSYYW